MDNKKEMTNREWLNTLSDEEFVRVVLEKESEFAMKYFCSELDALDCADFIRSDFEEWLCAKKR